MSDNTHDTGTTNRYGLKRLATSRPIVGAKLLSTVSPETEELIRRQTVGNRLFTRLKEWERDKHAMTCGATGLETTAAFESLVKPFTNAGLAMADIECRIDSTFSDCKTLKDMQDAVSRGTKLPRIGKDSFEWKIIISKDQYSALEDYYPKTPGPSKS